MDKRQAEETVLRMWRALPTKYRTTHEHAAEFAKRIAPSLPFETLGSHDQIVEAWLHRELLRSNAVEEVRTPEKPRDVLAREREPKRQSPTPGQTVWAKQRQPG